MLAWAIPNASSKAWHPDSPGDQVRSFNQQICRESQDSKFPLASCNPSRLRFASVAGSHFNQACRALLVGVPHTDASLTVDGHLHLERLQAKDAQFHSACVNGIKWRVIPCAVAERFQEIASLAQAAGNASGQIQKAEGELQLARQVLRSMDLWRQKTKKDSVRWSDIQAEVMRSRPPETSTAPFLFTFMMKCSGGRDGHFFTESDMYIRSHGWPARTMGGDFYDALAAAKAHFPAHAFEIRLLRARQVHQRHRCQARHHQQGVPQEGGQGVLQAQAVLDNLAHPLRPEIALKLLGELQCNLASWVLDKREAFHCRTCRSKRGASPAAPCLCQFKNRVIVDTLGHAI